MFSKNIWLFANCPQRELVAGVCPYTAVSRRETAERANERLQNVVGMFFSYIFRLKVIQNLNSKIIYFQPIPPKNRSLIHIFCCGSFSVSAFKFSRKVSKKRFKFRNYFFSRF
jgi:hypothetical protein